MFENINLIYSNGINGKSGVLSNYTLDMSVGVENDFSITVYIENNILQKNSIIHVIFDDNTLKNMEFGGIVDGIAIDTNTAQITYTGRTWRGVLASRILEPPTGEEYYKCYKTPICDVISDIINRCGLNGYFTVAVNEETQKIITYQFNRYITVLDAIISMLSSKNLLIALNDNGSKIDISTIPKTDYSNADKINSEIFKFKSSKTYNFVNHLICLGSGVGEFRIKIDLYCDENGTISREQTFFGNDEITDTYEYPQCETVADLVDNAVKRFRELIKKESINIVLPEEVQTFEIGDIVSAHDDVTGLTVRAEIAEKLLTFNDGIAKIRYGITNEVTVSDIEASKVPIRFTNDEITALWELKVDKEDGKGLSSNDYTDEDKHSLATIQKTAEGLELTVKGKADKDNIMSIISQSTESVKISAEKIELNGGVTFSSWAAGVAENIDNATYASLMATGKMLYTDPTFKKGLNSLLPYNNAANGNVTINRSENSAAINAPTDYVMEIKNTGAADPPLGGFRWGHPTRANAVFIYKIIAKLPEGAVIEFATNAVGDGYIRKWIKRPTGDNTNYKEYIFYLKCGSSGTFSSTGFFHLTGVQHGTVSNPVIWYVSYATVYDCTEQDNPSRAIADWCYDNDVTYIDGGKIYAKSITADQIASNTITAEQIDVDDLFSKNITLSGIFTATNDIYVPPTEKEYLRIKRHIFKQETIPDNELPLYNFFAGDGDSGVNALDYMVCKSIVVGEMTMEGAVANGFAGKKTKVTLTIDLKNPYKMIQISGTNMWGDTFDNHIGVGTLFTRGKDIKDFNFLVLNSNQYATESDGGLMSSEDKEKLNSISAYAQVNTITGIKGDAETEYRIGQVNLTAANVGAASINHTHNYAGSSSVGGSADTAAKLQTARKINGVEFDGTSNITVYDPRNRKTVNKGLNSSGWYRIAEIPYQLSVASFTIHLNREWNYLSNESYRFAVHLLHTYNHSNIVQLSGTAYTQVFTKIRMVTKSGDTRYIDVYYDSETANNCYVALTDFVNADTAEAVAFEDAIVPSDYTVAEYDIAKVCTLSASVGSTAQPVYFSNGVPVACTGVAAEKIVYESMADHGIYCDGNKTANSNNSVTFNDTTSKRFRFYIRTPYGLFCQEMPVDRTQESASSTWGSSYQSGIIAPTGDAETYGANKHYVYKMNWCLKKTSTGWTCQVTDAGWADTGLGVATAAQYAAATVDNISKNTHWVWNQRHNNSYSIYKIVGCST